MSPALPVQHARRPGRRAAGLLLLPLLLCASATGAQVFTLPDAGTPAAHLSAEPDRDTAVAAVGQLYAEPDAVPPQAALADVAARFTAPEAAFDFVRDRVALQAYPGAMRGPQATLNARAGNPLDRARLLSELLRAQGLATRLVRGSADPAATDRLFARIVAEPVAGRGTPTPFLDAVQARAARAYAGLREAALAPLQDRLDLAALRAPVRRDLAVHWWLEFERDGQWTAMDPSLRDAAVGEALATAGDTFDALPDDGHQAITLRVVAELETDGVLSRQVALEHRAPVEDFTRQVLVLGVADDGLGDTLAGALGEAMGLARFRPTLRIGKSQILGDSVELAASGDAGGGLLGALDFGADDAGAPPTLVGLVLEMSFHAPGAETWEVRRLLYDRLETQDRFAWEAGGHADGTRATPRAEDPTRLAQALRTQHLLHAYDAAHDPGHWLETTRQLMDAVLQSVQAGASPDAPLPAEDAQNLQSVAWRALPITSDLFALPAVNDRDGLRFFPERPRMLVVSSHAPAEGDGAVVSVDLLQERLRAVPADDLAPQALAERRLWFAALQGALEAEFVALPLLLSAPDADTRVGGAAFLEDLRLSQAAPARDAGIARRHAQRAGRLAVVGTGDDDSFWDIDPSSGEARAVSEPGLGNASYKKVVRSLSGSGEYGRGVHRISQAEVDRILSNARRPLGKPMPRSAANEYQMTLSAAIYSSVPASLAVGITTGTGMIIGVIAVSEGLRGRDWTDGF